MITIILIFIISILLWSYYNKYYSYRGKLLSAMPSLPTWPFIGNVDLCASLIDLWYTLRRLNGEYYPFYAVWFIYDAIIHTRNPDHVKELIATRKHMNKGRVYVFLKAWLGTGLLTSTDRKWQERRKLLTRAFHFNILQSFVHTFINETKHSCESLKKEGGPVVKDLLPFASELTLNIICESAMGCSLRDKEEFTKKYRAAVVKTGQIITKRFVSPWVYHDYGFIFTPTYWRQRRLIKILHGFTETIIKERKLFHDQTNGQYLKSCNENEIDNETLTRGHLGDHKTRLAMLDLLIAAQKNGQIDDEGIQEEVDTFVFEGHDTVAAAVCFTIMLLAEHQEIQDRVRKEFDAVLEKNGEKLTMASLQELSYTERCIKESLRLYPSVHTIDRQTSEEIHLSGYKIPADTDINMFIVDLHRDPNYWPNPDVFDPDRFLPENIRGRHPYCYIPFSAGPRNCIGQRYAMLELKVIIGLLLHNFRLEPVDYLKEVTFIADLIMRPAYQMRTRFVPIKEL